MTATPTSISCSVVSGSDPQAIVEFLRSFEVAAHHLADCEVSVTAIVNSGDPALALRIADLADSVLVRSSPVGFAANHNQCLASTDAEYHVIANDDVVVDAECLRVLLDVAREPAYHDVAVISPLLRNPDGTLQQSTYSFPSSASVIYNWSGVRGLLPERATTLLARVLRRGQGSSRHWKHDAEVAVQTLRGAFVLVRTEAVRQVGLMSEVALVGGEETEWHARFAASGWRVLFTPRAHVMHVGRVTTGSRPDLDVEYVKGTVNFFSQHGSRGNFLAVKAAGLVRVAYLRLHSLATTGARLPCYGLSVRAIAFRRKEL